MDYSVNKQLNPIVHLAHSVRIPAFDTHAANREAGCRPDPKAI